jgi:heme exporter protein D
MNHANFVFAAYAITGAGILWLLISSFAAMRKSEALADDLRKSD